MKMKFDVLIRGVLLTRRMALAYKGIQHGHTSRKELAKYMGISYRTSEYYFRALRKKYSCYTKKQLISTIRRG